MKSKKLKKIIAVAIVSTIVSTIAPVTALAEWLQDSQNIWSWLENGNKIIGWKLVDGVWYYFDNEGNMQLGWVKTSDSKWYYMNSDGSMKTGWLKSSDGKWYYLGSDGDMKTGWIQEADRTRYFTDSTGVMQTGVITVDGNSYALAENGAMLIGKSVLTEGNTYTTDTTGVIIGLKTSDNSKEFNKDGVRITHTENKNTTTTSTENTSTNAGSSTSSSTSSSHHHSSSKQSILKIEAINTITVRKGTDLDSAQLPSYANITLLNNTTISAKVTWDEGTPIYDKNTVGTYSFKGTVELPKGVTNPNNLKASVKVNVVDSATEEKILSSVQTISDINVAIGTELNEAQLPGYVDVKLSNNTTTSVAVSWNNGNPTYDENTLGTYAFSGKLILTEGVTNPNNLKVNVNINVRNYLKYKTVSTTVGGGGKNISYTDTYEHLAYEGADNNLIVMVSIKGDTDAYPEMVSDDLVNRAISYSNAANVKTTMMKLHLGTNFSDGYGRAAYHPDPATFFPNWEKICLHYAQMCTDNNIPILCIGCEQTKQSIDANYSYWEHIVKEIKKQYPNLLLTYAAHVSEYKKDKPLEFWKLFDFIGFNMYFDYTDKLVSQKPTLDEIKKAYYTPYYNGKSPVDLINMYANAFNKKIFITETGLMPRDSGLINHYDSKDVGPKTYDGTALAMQAIFDDLCQNDNIIGFSWWHVNNPFDYFSKTERTSAEETMRRYLKGGLI